MRLPNVFVFIFTRGDEPTCGPRGNIKLHNGVQIDFGAGRYGNGFN